MVDCDPVIGGTLPGRCRWPGSVTTCLVQSALGWLVVAGAAQAAVDGPSPGGATAANFGEAPPPPRAMPAGADLTLYLELVVNGLPSGKIVPVARRKQHFFVDAQTLRELGVRVGEQRGPVDCQQLARVSTSYDENSQQLHLDVPADWLPTQRLGRQRLYDRMPATSSLGFLFNYDFYATDTSGGATSALWTEQRLFDGFGEISNSGVWNHTFRGPTSEQSNRYIRYDTHWTFSDQDHLRTYTAGDLVTGALPWTSAVRMGGFSVARDFSVRPDLITYPLPAFAGQASVPTTLDLFINGVQTSHNEVRPGPFTINDTPFINGAGEATVVTTDALGRQVSTTVPFYVASSMLQQGLSDYSLAVGALRRNYGLRSVAYGETAANGSFRYGISRSVTLESHAEAARHLALGGLGANLAISHFGTLNVAGAGSRSEGLSGRQWSVGYTYYAPVFGWSTQHLQRSAGYTDLSRYADGVGQLIRRSDQLSLSLSLGRLGNLGLGYFDVRTAGGRELVSANSLLDGDTSGAILSQEAGYSGQSTAIYSPGTRTRLVSLSWTKSIFGRSSLYAYINRNIGDGGYSAQLQLLIQLDDSSSLTASTQRNSSGSVSEQLRYSRNVPSQGGFGWNMAYAGGDQHYQQADLTWRGPYAQLQGGVYGGSGDYTRWGEASGSVVWMDRSIYASNRINDAFVLVSTDGYAGVPVRYENQRVGVTNASGHLLVPWVTSYYRAKFEIDPLNLPPNVQTPKVEDYLSVRRGSGALLQFPVERVIDATIILVDAKGRPLPRGTEVTDRDNGQQSPVGWDGLVYFSALQADNHLVVALPGGRHCEARFGLDLTLNRTAQLGPLTCR